MTGDQIEQHIIPFNQLLTAINALLDSHEELDTVAEKNRTVSAVRFMIDELERRAKALYEALYHDHFAATASAKEKPAND